MNAETDQLLGRTVTTVLVNVFNHFLFLPIWDVLTKDTTDIGLKCPRVSCIGSLHWL